MPVTIAAHAPRSYNPPIRRNPPPTSAVGNVLFYLQTSTLPGFCARICGRIPGREALHARPRQRAVLLSGDCRLQRRFTVVSFSATEAISQPYAIELEILGDGFDLDLTSLMYKPAWLSCGSEQGFPGRVFKDKAFTVRSTARPASTTTPARPVTRC